MRHAFCAPFSEVLVFTPPVADVESIIIAAILHCLQWQYAPSLMYCRPHAELLLWGLLLPDLRARQLLLPNLHSGEHRTRLLQRSAWMYASSISG